MKPWKVPPGGLVAHAMTCDVEDYFQVSAFNALVQKQDWNNLECRIPQNIDRILQRLSDNGARATFFTLGWVAENYPEIVRRIASAGHEVASHGMYHNRVWQQDRQEFLQDAGTAKKLLEDVSGTEVIGYRAASWSIDARTPWAHEVLREAGYRYSSSLYPIAHDHFGVPDAPPYPHYVGQSELLEIPASVVRVFGRNIPASGGGFFRLYPLKFSTWLIEQVVKGQQSPYLFYFHPWELDPSQPRIKDAPRKARFRHYLNLDRFEKRWTALLTRYQWDRMDRIYLGDTST